VTQGAISQIERRHVPTRIPALRSSIGLEELTKQNFDIGGQNWPKHLGASG